MCYGCRNHTRATRPRPRRRPKAWPARGRSRQESKGGRSHEQRRAERVLEDNRNNWRKRGGDRENRHRLREDRAAGRSRRRQHPQKTRRSNKSGLKRGGRAGSRRTGSGGRRAGTQWPARRDSVAGAQEAVAGGQGAVAGGQEAVAGAQGLSGRRAGSCGRRTGSSGWRTGSSGRRTGTLWLADRDAVAGGQGRCGRWTGSCGRRTGTLWLAGRDAVAGGQGRCGWRAGSSGRRAGSSGRRAGSRLGAGGKIEKKSRPTKAGRERSAPMSGYYLVTLSSHLTIESMTSIDRPHAATNTNHVAHIGTLV